MRNVLDQDPAAAAPMARSKSPAPAVRNVPAGDGLGCRARALRPTALRCPDLDIVAGLRKAAGEQTSIVAHAAELRRVFSRYYVPAEQCVLAKLDGQASAGPSGAPADTTNPRAIKAK